MQYSEPSWAPLRALVGAELAHWFMWMCEVELADGVQVQAYKHISTRRYLHLANDCRAFLYTAGPIGDVPAGGGRPRLL